MGADLLDKTLLVIAPDFPDREHRYIGGIFVKHQVEEIRKHFRKVVVIAPVPRSFGRVPSDRFCRDYSFDNVSVFFPRALFVPRRLRLPFVDRYKFFLDRRLPVVDRLIQREGINFDLIHAHFTWPSGGIALRLKDRYQVPVVLTIHEDPGWLAEEISSGNQLLTGSWVAADAIVRVNRKDVPLLEPYNPHVTAIPNGYSPEFRPMDRERCRRELGIPDGRKVLFSLGYLVEQKGFTYLIRAMRQVCDSRDEIDCYIGGSGPLREQLQKEVDGLNLHERVRLLGFVEDSLVPAWMGAADLFVLPSLSESFGIVQVEAMACGTPVIATRNGGSEEVIVPDLTGLLCPPADGPVLARNIEEGLEYQWDREAIIHYASRFSWECVSGEILAVYRSLRFDQEPARSLR
ncbi:D-inositol-3-phosphate glycosyltransferase [anaerobic digester metagenome]